MVDFCTIFYFGGGVTRRRKAVKVYRVYEVWCDGMYCGYYLESEYDIAVAYAREIGGEVREGVRIAAM